MTKTVFWSWQSDMPARETRDVIREALKIALGRIAIDLEPAERPEIDQDTRNVAGSPDIVATILAKIDSAAVFVADVTPIAVSEGAKHLANPNVLIELGYAKRSLGLERVITVWNTALWNSRVEDLPFDMRQKRAPISFSLKSGASKPELATARDQIAKELEDRVRASLAIVAPPATTEPVWQPHFDCSPSFWAAQYDELPTNCSQHGQISLKFRGARRAYARLIPTHWKSSVEYIKKLASNEHHLVQLNVLQNISWGPCSGGFVAWETSNPHGKIVYCDRVTRWFKANGEFWGLSNGPFRDDGNDKVSVFADDFGGDWTLWLKRHIQICKALGGRGPFHVELGLDGLAGSQWREAYRSAFALEPSGVYRTVLPNGSPAEIAECASKAVDVVREAFGLGPLSIHHLNRAKYL